MGAPRGTYTAPPPAPSGGLTSGGPTFVEMLQTPCSGPLNRIRLPFEATAQVPFLHQPG